ncbi:NfeD family protein [Halocatena marina]|uniref:NfeD family protein n=1 Tax=Halocatena marina TaxID=2934937 RepID=A0ABD5YQI6_9EURY|nr:NfeD family protein [Halocatena marina]
MDTIVLQIADWLTLPIPVLLLLAGAGLMIAEALAPGAHFIVIGIALLIAGAVGIALSGLGLTLFPTLIGMALTVLIAGGLSLYTYREFDIYGGKGSGRTSDSDALRGKTGHVTEDVSRSGGEVKLEDGGFNPYYQARTLDGEIPAGEEIMVLDPGGGNVITVEALSAIEDDIDRELAKEYRNEEREPDTA